MPALLLQFWGGGGGGGLLKATEPIPHLTLWEFSCELLSEFVELFVGQNDVIN